VLEHASPLERIRDRFRRGHFRLSEHATKQMGLRGRTLEDVRRTIVAGEIIWEYPGEHPYPEFLFLGYPGQPDEPCYVAVSSNDETVIVTLHNYDPEVYEANHGRRRKRP
jgi:hypothetical protein